MKIKSVSLETVCGVTSKLPGNLLPEVAFAGRSNAGKSTLINCLMERKSLARTSEKPGKTQTINFYNINGEIYLVDLPGYGYAKISKKETEKWGKMIEKYLTSSEMLRVIFLLVDIRHTPKEMDVQMFDWIRYLEYQPIVIATKADKLKQAQIEKHLAEIRRTLSMDEEDILIPFSSVTRLGREEVLDFMEQVIENEREDEREE